MSPALIIYLDSFVSQRGFRKCTFLFKGIFSAKPRCQMAPALLCLSDFSAKTFYKYVEQVLFIAEVLFIGVSRKNFLFMKSEVKTPLGQNVLKIFIELLSKRRWFVLHEP